jgi:hypothetical protein
VRQLDHDSLTKTNWTKRQLNHKTVVRGRVDGLLLARAPKYRTEWWFAILSKYQVGIKKAAEISKPFTSSNENEMAEGRVTL